MSLPKITEVLDTVSVGNTALVLFKGVENGFDVYTIVDMGVNGKTAQILRQSFSQEMGVTHLVNEVRARR